jgi:hypothetical protein
VGIVARGPGHFVCVEAQERLRENGPLREDFRKNGDTKPVFACMRLIPQRLLNGFVAGFAASGRQQRAVRLVLLFGLWRLL